MLSYSRQIAIVCKDRSYDKENAQVRCKKMEPIAKEATRDALKLIFGLQTETRILLLAFALKMNMVFSSCISLASVLKTQ